MLVIRNEFQMSYEIYYRIDQSVRAGWRVDAYLTLGLENG